MSHVIMMYHFAKILFQYKSLCAVDYDTIFFLLHHRVKKFYKVLEEQKSLLGIHDCSEQPCSKLRKAKYLDHRVVEGCNQT